MVATLPPYIKQTADALHEQVRFVRKGADAMGCDLNDLTDLEVLAILRWCETNTPIGREASKTMIGLLYTMKG